MLLAIAFFSDCAQPQLVLIFFIILGCGHGPATSGFYTSIVTLAPAHVGVLSSISMLVGCGGMLFTPLLGELFHSSFKYTCFSQHIQKLCRCFGEGYIYA